MSNLAPVDAADAFRVMRDPIDVLEWYVVHHSAKPISILPHRLALAALYPRQIDNDPGQVRAERHVANPAVLAAAPEHIPRATARTAALLRLWLDMEQDHAAVELGLRERVAANVADNRLVDMRAFLFGAVDATPIRIRMSAISQPSAGCSGRTSISSRVAFLNSQSRL